MTPDGQTVIVTGDILNPLIYKKNVRHPLNYELFQRLPPVAKRSYTMAISQNAQFVFVADDNIIKVYEK